MARTIPINYNAEEVESWAVPLYPTPGYTPPVDDLRVLALTDNQTGRSYAFQMIEFTHLGITFNTFTEQIDGMIHTPTEMAIWRAALLDGAISPDTFISAITYEPGPEEYIATFRRIVTDYSVYVISEGVFLQRRINRLNKAVITPGAELGPLKNQT